MSRQSYSYSNQKKSKVVPAGQAYCAHCANIGKPESVFRSHYVRESSDANSKIVCPELLATECPYCYKTGHTKSRCPILLAEEAKRIKKEKQQKYMENVQKKKEAEQKTEAPKKSANSTKFSALMSDSDSEEEETQVSMNQINKRKPRSIVEENKPVVDQFPALTAKAKVAPINTPAVSYAGMTAKTKSQYEDEQFLKEKMKKNAIPIPSLKREQAAGISHQQQPDNNFWNEWDSQNEDEMEYAARQIEIEEYKKKLLNMRASNMDDWGIESDDEDW